MPDPSWKQIPKVGNFRSALLGTFHSAFTKPGALRNGAPFKEWELPPAMRRVQHRLGRVPDGDRQMVDILGAALTDGLDAVEDACAEALSECVHSAAVILNVLARRREPPPPLTIATPEALRQTGWFLPAKSVDLRANWMAGTPEFKSGEAVQRFERAASGPVLRGRAAARRSMSSGSTTARRTRRTAPPRSAVALSIVPTSGGRGDIAGDRGELAELRHRRDRDRDLAGGNLSGRRDRPLNPPRRRTPRRRAPVIRPQACSKTSPAEPST